MVLIEWKITISERESLSDAEVEEILESLEWMPDTDLPNFIESKMPAKYIDKVKIRVNE